MRICDFTKPELDHFRDQCNFTTAEMQAFNMKAKDCTNIQIAMKLNVSESTVAVIMRRVRTKIAKVLSWTV